MTSVSARKAALELRELARHVGLRIIYIQKASGTRIRKAIEVPVYDGNGTARLDARSSRGEVRWDRVFSNAAHEVGHWLLAGESRRLVDYGAYFGDRPWATYRGKHAIDHDESEASCLGIWIQRYLLNEESAVETFEDHGWTYESFEEISRDLRNKSHLRFEGDAIELNGAPIAIEQIKEGRKKHVQEVVG